MVVLSPVCFYSLGIIFNFIIEALPHIILKNQKLVIYLCTCFAMVSPFSLFLFSFLLIFLFWISAVLSTNNCNFKMNNSSGSLYPELACLRANIIQCVHTQSLLFFKKRRKKYVRCQKVFVLNYVYIGCFILTVLLGSIFKCGDILLDFIGLIYIG